MSERHHKFIQKYGMPLGLLLLVLLLQAIQIHIPLLSFTNIRNTLMQTTSISLAALGLSFIMISGEGDMSFAGMFSMLSVVFAMTANYTNRFAAALLVTLAAALGVNLMIAFFVTRLNFSSFIVSIAVMFMATGVEKALHQQTTLIQNPEITAFSTVEFGLPLVVLLMFTAYIISYIVVNKTKFGFQLRVVGENRDAGIEAGMDGRKLKMTAYMIAAVLLAMASSIESTRVGAIYEQGKYYMLPIFAACYLGSSMFVTGRINIAGTFVGALFMGIADSFMKMMNVESYMISIVQGAILIISVGLACFKNRDKIQQIKV